MKELEILWPWAIFLVVLFVTLLAALAAQRRRFNRESAYQRDIKERLRYLEGNRGYDGGDPDCGSSDGGTSKISSQK